MAGKQGQAPRVEFSQAMFDRICTLIADGKSVRQACSGDGMPDRATFNGWRKRTPELQAQYDQAYRDYEDSTLQDIVHIADTERDAAIARNRIDARKWELKIRNRKRFGDHVVTEHTGEDGGAIQHVHTVNLVALKGDES
ncbi:terminase small subunit-like protein [Paraburkholderia sediminicola]|uniref:terminase small subunit-like protein n=1 Tax=Paraburkholderia sediminicola TaxID=458836 RepID=UPI0038BC012F